MLQVQEKSLRARMSNVCKSASAPNAADVDAKARLPVETIAALKAERLMGVMVPAELGGEDASLSQIADICCQLAAACASSGMIYAMHMIKLHNLITGGRSSAWHRSLMTRVVNEQLLLGSATTEAGIGGDLRNSICAVESAGADFSLRKDASVISYALGADAIFATARRAPSSVSSDQVMVALMRDQYELQPTHAWDTLGMRGTCSEGFILTGRAPAEQIFPLPFAELAAQSMLSAAHILWGAVWFGIATNALERARATVRAEARRNPDVKPPAATPLAEAGVKLHQLRATLSDAIERFEKAKHNPDVLGSIGFAVDMNNVKISASRLATEIVLEALRICGIQGYRNDGPNSIGRHLRDVLSAPLMIANDRIISNVATASLVAKFDATLAN